MIRFKALVFLAGWPMLLCGQLFQSYTQSAKGLRIQTTDGILSISPMSERAIRVTLEKKKNNNLEELIVVNPRVDCAFQIEEQAETLQLTTAQMMVRFDKRSGQVTFANRKGKVFLKEKAGSRKLQQCDSTQLTCYSVEQSFETEPSESIFGLGQFQDGHFNLNGVTRRLTQVNSQIAIPFIYSDKGYGLLWHQYGLTDFNPADQVVELQPQQTTSPSDGSEAEVTTTSGTQKIEQGRRLYGGHFVVPQDGIYTLFLDLGNMDNRHLLVIDGQACIDQSNMWLPPTVSQLVRLAAGEHRVEVLCKSDNVPKLYYALRRNYTTFRSPVGTSLDYVVFYGPSADDVIASYRRLSGNVPMFPLWAYGFWQCRERYTSAEQLIETVKEFRKRKIPMDVIVQDWQYWGNSGWGVPVFDSVHYANPAGFIQALHRENAHFNVSIWSNPDPNSSVGKAFANKQLYLLPQCKWLDYFNPETRRDYWAVLNKNMFSQGVDSWWMDAVEPENDALKGLQTHSGSGDLYRLTYPYMVSKTVYEGQRNTSDSKRVCILTRSAFPGQQRYGIINSSGDIGATWDTFRRQIVAGLNYMLTGFAYWTTDIGGFFRPGASQYTDPNYAELLTRWYQWGAFNPVFRVHGYMSETEPWKYGKTVEQHMRAMLSLRYRLLPYIYSEAWQVTSTGSTLMRPLVMDFRADTSAVRVPYQFMFGHALLVAPVTEPHVAVQKIYLPKSTCWFNFYTHRMYCGGQTIMLNASLDTIPLLVKAGSILPIGPEQQYATEKKWDKLEIRVYEGANGQFNLYEDETDNYNYERGCYSCIRFSWNQSAQRLTIEKRKGHFKGMMPKREFLIQFISSASGKKCIRRVYYVGNRIVVSR